MRIRVTTLLFFSILFCCAFSVSAQSAKDEQEMQNARSIGKMVQLMYEGKFKEAFPIVDSLKIAAQNNDENKHWYFSLLLDEAIIYEGIGNFPEAEQLFKQILSGDVTAKSDEGEHRLILNQLSILYEKMGRTGVPANNKATATLEELVVSEYDKAQAPKTKGKYFDKYMKIARNAYDKRQEEFTKQYNALVQNNKMDQSNKPEQNDELAQKKHAFLLVAKRYFETVLAAKFDSVTVASLIIQQTAGKDSIDLSSQIPLMVAGYPTTQSVPKPPVAKHPVALGAQLLREGKLQLGGGRNGFNSNDPWSEVKQLFRIYLNNKNFIAAEALIRQAIAVDDRHEWGKIDNENYIFNQMMTPMETGIGPQVIPPVLTGYRQQLQTLKKKYNGIDVFYLQNKLLLAQVYRDTHRNSSYQLLTDTVYRLCKILDTVSNPMVINLLASLYADLGKFEDAKHAYNKIIGYHKTQTGATVVSAPLYLNVFNKLDTLYLTSGDNQQAERVMLEALAFDKETGGEKYPDHIDRAIRLAQLYENTGQYKLAEQTCSTVLGAQMDDIHTNFNFLSEKEKIELLNAQTSVFDFSGSLLIDNPASSGNFTLQAYNQLLQLKSFVLNDEQKIFDEIRQNGDAALKRVFAQWLSNRAAIARQYSQPVNRQATHLIDSLGTIANEQEKKIAQSTSALQKFDQGRQTGFKQIEQKLHPGEAAVEFVRFKYFHKKWTDSAWYAAFVIMPGDVSPRFVPLCEERKILSFFKTDIGSQTFVKDFYGDEQAGGHQAGNGLYKLIWAPLKPLLKGVTRLDISPAGLLNNISFDALSSNGDGYLTDQYQEIRRYNSIREITEQQQAIQNANAINVVLYGDIHYGIAAPKNEGDKKPRFVWSHLSTEGEVEQINSIFKDNKINCNAITNYDATEESLKQLSGHSPTILHIATHGFSKPPKTSKTSGTAPVDDNQFTTAGNPMLRNGLIMANANRVWSGGLPVKGTDDGILTAYEIANLDLSHTRLVVLSACETALGDIEGNEGTFGLQRAFKLAGVQNMILSLWDLANDQTTQFITAFYKNKIQKNMPDYKALKTTQDEFRKDHKAPLNWAGFVLIE